MRVFDAGLAVLSAVGWSTGLAGSMLDGEVHVRIRLYGVTASNVATVQAARVPADSVLRDVGLVPEWLDCGVPHPDPVCTYPPGPEEFVVRLVAALADSPQTCGASLRPHGPLRGHFITIFTDCVQGGADQVQARPAVVFAYTLLHEIGHLLLPEGHSRRGVMRTRLDRFDWLRASRASLRFSGAEGAQMQAALRQQMLLATGPQ